MTNHALKKISELDVFCLLVFKIIFQTGHANTAAKELNVSAPKISRCLTMLRATFDDELFYRRQLGLKPTPLAEHLYEPICRFCDSVAKIEQVAFEVNHYDSTPTLNIAVTPGIMASLSLILSNNDSLNSIGKIRLHPWKDDSAELIHSGGLDLGVAFDTSCHHDLNFEHLGTLDSVYLAGNTRHPIWERLPHLTLDDICKHPFLYLEGKGFNDKVDPLEVYSRQSGIELLSVEKVKGKEQWYSNLLTMGSLAFAPAVEAEICKNMPGIRIEQLPEEEVEKLHGNMLAPQYYLIEKPASHRRYTVENREMIINIIKGLLTSS
ncbi:LysR family transcriptional regulator [Shewanella canadensis]|uniref:LysR family transcriptional regulator n=1 Tax=Shewanella canadensis TaxID=271096 RepID=A0A431WZX7_9GAMM|nr:LysR family transcriptional regulator [Shewanella canadensis]RTR40900.1 LysR family transcriptional regulator [Shewanella canadensis]